MNDYIAYSVVAAVWVFAAAPLLFSNDFHMSYTKDVISGLKVTAMFSATITVIFLIVISVDHIL